jgi:type IV pilus assembly protein PilM
MGIFNRKEKITGMIGLDIGASGLKLVELIEKDGRKLLSTYGHVSINKRDSSNEQPPNPAELGRILKELAKKCDIQQKRVNVSLPSHAVFHAIITIPQPKKSDENIQLQIESRVKQLLPLPIEEMVLDSTIIDTHLLPKASSTQKKGDEENKITNFSPLGTTKEAPKFIRVLVSGSPKKLISEYIETVKVAGLELVSLETESFGLIRSLIGNDKSRIMILDIGQARTNIEIVQEGIPFLHRSIKAGGADLTQAIAKSTSVDIDTAEQIKKDLGQVNGDLEMGEVPDYIKDVLQPIIHEARYSLDLYAKQDFHNNKSVEKVIITGGSSHIPYLDPLITQALNINVFVGDPWARILTPPPIKPLLDEIGPIYAIAVGLAMKK